MSFGQNRQVVAAEVGGESREERRVVFPASSASPVDGDSGAGSPAGEKTLDEGNYDRKLSGHPDCPRVGSRGRRVEISMGGPIPFVPAVSTGKPVTVRCQ